MPIVTPRTWVAGDVLTAAQMNVDVRDNVTYLANPPSCRVYNSANINIANDTWTLLTFNSERYDSGALHSTAVNTGRITVVDAGLYLITLSVGFADGNDYHGMAAKIRLNNLSDIAHQGVSGNASSWLYGSPSLTVTTLYKLAATDYVEGWAWQRNSISATRIVGAYANFSPEFSAIRLGIG